MYGNFIMLDFYVDIYFLFQYVFILSILVQYIKLRYLYFTGKII